MSIELECIRVARETGDHLGQRIDIFTLNEVCPVCQGRGKHSQNLGAFAGDEMDEMGDEFRQDYIAGYYDTQCEECKGLRVVEVLDRTKTAGRVVALIDGMISDHEDMYATEAAERRAGA